MITKKEKEKRRRKEQPKQKKKKSLLGALVAFLGTSGPASSTVTAATLKTLFGHVTWALNNS